VVSNVQGRVFVVFKVFKNRVLRRIVGPKEGRGTGGWRELHNEMVCDLYFPNIVAY
jgi:hypothetical protein